jgi:hypothetical protein
MGKAAQRSEAMCTQVDKTIDFKAGSAELL